MRKTEKPKELKTEYLQLSVLQCAPSGDCENQKNVRKETNNMTASVTRDVTLTTRVTVDILVQMKVNAGEALPNFFHCIHVIAREAT